MSRTYEMMITVQGCTDEQREPVFEALQEVWNISDEWGGQGEHGLELTFVGESSLCGGETEDEFFRRVVKRLRKIDNGFGVEVKATYLENLPYETYVVGCGEELEEEG